MQALKYFACGLGLALLTSHSFASNSGAEYNIANGLAPEVTWQSISPLKAFRGDFRILSTKSYSQDEQAKFSPNISPRPMETRISFSPHRSSLII